MKKISSQALLLQFVCLYIIKRVKIASCCILHTRDLCAVKRAKIRSSVASCYFSHSDNWRDL